MWRLCAFALLAPSASWAIAPPDVLVLAGVALAKPLLLLASLFSIPAGWFYLHSGAYRLRRFVRPWNNRVTHRVLVAIAIVGALQVVRFIGADKVAPVITVEEVQRERFSAQPPLFVDLRAATAFGDWHLPGAVNMPGPTRAREYVERQLLREPQRKILLYCIGGSSSSLTINRVLSATTDAEKRVATEARLLYIDGGYNTMRRAERVTHLGAVQQVWATLADVWIAAGEALRVEITASSLDRDPTLLQAKHLASTTGRIIVLSLSGLRPEQIEARLGMQDDWPRVYIGDDADLSRPPPLAIARAALALKRIFGGTGQAIGFLLATQIMLMMGLRILTLRRLFAHAEGPMRWVEAILGLGFVLLLREVNNSFFELQGRTMGATQAAFSTFHIIAVVLIAASGLGRQLACPPAERTRRLRSALQSAYLGESRPHYRFGWHAFSLWVTAYFIVMLVTMLADFHLLVFLAIGLVLHAPFAMDWLLSRWFAYRLARSTNPMRLFLRTIGARFVRAETALRLQTRSLGNPGRLQLVGAGQMVEIGIFSGRCFPAVAGADLLQATDSKGLQALGRRLWDVWRRDVVACLDCRGRLIDVQPLDAPFDSDAVLHEQVFAHAAAGGDAQIQTVCLDATALAETIAHPTPLSLDLLKQRWSVNGGARRALARFGWRPRRQQQAGEHLVVLGARVYKDLVAERRLFERGRFAAALARIRLTTALQLAARTIEEDFLTWFEPRAHHQLYRLRVLIADETVSDGKLLRAAVAALDRLAGEAAEWQEYVAFTHQQLHQELERALAPLAFDLESVRNQNGPPAARLAMYELYRGSNGASDCAAPIPAGLRERIHTWHAIERCKQRTRDLYLEEIAVVGTLLDKVGRKLGLCGNTCFLTIAELSELPRGRAQLGDVIAARKQKWDRLRGIMLPARLSLADLESEGLATRSFAPAVAANAELRGMRVSGPREPREGIVRLVESAADVVTPTADQIIVTTGVAPEDIVRLGGAGAIVTEEGGALCHTAILAREMGLSLVMRVAGATTRLRDRQVVRLLPDGTIIEIDKPSSLYVPLALITDRATGGAKAFALARMIRAGFPVPDGVVLSRAALALVYRHWNIDAPGVGASASARPEAPRQAQLPHEVRTLLQELGARFHFARRLIVRSSSTLEDRPGRSYAGLFHSQACNNDVDALADAIVICWRSACEPAPLQYDAQPIAARHELNLIVQPYLEGSVGGVLFTRNPLDGSDAELMIEVSPDGVEAAVQGRNVESFTIPRDTSCVLPALYTPLLSSAQIGTLLAYALRCEKLFGTALDIEWTVVAGEIKLLQARPAT